MGQKYLDGLREVLDRIGPTQGESLARAADLIAEAVAAGGAVHLLDTGHLLMQEMFGRVGGLMLLRPVKVAVEVENPGPARPGRVKRKVYLDEIAGLPAFVLDRSDIFPGGRADRRLRLGQERLTGWGGPPGQRAQTPRVPQQPPARRRRVQPPGAGGV